jgi:succinyl-CoA synthetase alpha subunit
MVSLCFVCPCSVLAREIGNAVKPIARTAMGAALTKSSPARIWLYYLEKCSSLHTREAAPCGAKKVAGVKPGKRCQDFGGMQLFNSVYAAVTQAGAHGTGFFVLPQVTADAMLVAVDAGIEIIVCMAAGITVV